MTADKQVEPNPLASSGPSSGDRESPASSPRGQATSESVAGSDPRELSRVDARLNALLASRKLWWCVLFLSPVLLTLSFVLAAWARRHHHDAIAGVLALAGVVASFAFVHSWGVFDKDKD